MLYFFLQNCLGLQFPWVEVSKQVSVLFRFELLPRYPSQPLPLDYFSIFLSNIIIGAGFSSTWTCPDPVACYLNDPPRVSSINRWLQKIMSTDDIDKESWLQQRFSLRTSGDYTTANFAVLEEVGTGSKCHITSQTSVRAQLQENAETFLRFWLKWPQLQENLSTR